MVDILFSGSYRESHCPSMYHCSLRETYADILFWASDAYGLHTGCEGCSGGDLSGSGSEGFWHRPKLTLGHRS